MKENVIGVAAILALILGGIATFRAPVSIVERIVGSSSAPGLVGGCSDSGGVVTCYAHDTFKTGTTTPFAAKSPNATSTVSMACTTSNSTTTAQTFRLTTGAGLQSSTTNISNAVAVATGALSSITASSSLNSLLVLGPNSYVQFNAIGGVGTSNLTGTCSVEFKVI